MVSSTHSLRRYSFIIANSNDKQQRQSGMALLRRILLASSNYKCSPAGLFKCANRHLSTGANHTSKRLEGKITVITGAANGIGAKTAELFTRHGAKVIIGDIDDKNGRALAEKLGEGSFFSHCDVRMEEDIKALVDLAVSKHGRLDIMINNAGILSSSPTPTTSIVEMDAGDLDCVLKINLVGMALGVKHAARVMIPAKSGCILLTGSLATVIAGGACHPYTISKHGALGVARTAAAELAQHGIRVNCISPTVVDTKVLDHLGKFHPAVHSFISQTKVDPGQGQRHDLVTLLLLPEEIAETFLAMASDETRFISGQNIVIDGNLANLGPWNLFKLP